MSSTTIVRLVMGASALVLAGLSGASAQEGTAVKSLLGSMGIIPKERPVIHYRERAPLVLPPKYELRTPAAPGSVASRAGNWPRDPDVVAAQREAEEGRKPYTQTDHYRNSEGRPLSIQEIRAGRRVGPAANTFDGGYRDNRAESATRLSPTELRGYDKSEAKLSGDGLERRALTDPPGPLLKAAGGGKLKVAPEAREWGDPDSPDAFRRQQRAR